MKITDFIIPFIALFIIVYGYIKKIDIYSSFVDGVKEGVTTVLEIFPYLLTMLFAINILVKSNAIYFVLSPFTKVFSFFSIPIDIVPLIFLKPISGSSSLALINDLFSNFGVDSYIGRLASVLQGSSDTTIYILSLYFGSVGIKNTKYALFNGLFADFIGIIASIVLVNLLFY